MKRILLTALLALGLFTTQVQAQTPTDPVAADHEALRQLKVDLETMMAQRDFDMAAKLMHDPFMVTLVTQDSFTSLPSLKSYYDSLFSRETMRLKDLSISADADELSQIHTGTFALTRGSTKEHYEMADGRQFDLKGRWTAVSLKEPDGRWRLLGIHTGTNFLDNPVLGAIEKSLWWFFGGGALAGLVAGFVLAWLLRRPRRAA